MGVSEARYSAWADFQVFITTAVISSIGVSTWIDVSDVFGDRHDPVLSSTAIVLQTLNEKGLISTDAGQSSFSVLLFQDIAVIPMFALLPLLAVTTAGSPADSAPAHQGHVLGGGSSRLGTCPCSCCGHSLSLLSLDYILYGLFSGLLREQGSGSSLPQRPCCW